MTVRLDRLQQGLYEALHGVAAVVAWADGEQPLEAGSLLSLSLSAGPVLGFRQHAYGTTLQPADSITIVVTGATVGSRQIVRLNGFDYRHDVEAGNTATTIRDQLLASIQLGEAGAVTAAASGADRLALAADFLGGLRRLTLHGPDLDSESASFSGAAVLERVGSVSHTVTLQAFAKGRSPRNGAAVILDAVLDRLTDVETVAELSRYGVALWDKGPTVNLDAIAGAHWESRRSIDITVAARTVKVSPVEQIESAQVAVSIGGHGEITAVGEL